MKPDPAGSRPSATYRLQLHRGFAFEDAARIVPYLHRLGVSHVYASPIFRARPGSLHGYDVVDHSEVNPELGGEEGLRTLAAALQERGMGLILDLVPNHMCIAGAENALFADVLENGPASQSAAFFDIDWSPPKEELRDKVLLPVLGDQYGRVLENQEIRVERQGGTFHARYYQHVFPLAPKSYPVILEPVRERLAAVREAQDPERAEIESILTAIDHLPPRSEPDPDRILERQREKDVIRRRLAALVETSAIVREAVAASLEDLNGRRGDPRSFDRLEALLAVQGYRLSHWRVAADEINYRRFFDINELAAVRVEDPGVFEALHALPLRLAGEGLVCGLRIDHVDGLLDPEDYLRRLPDDLYVVVEKILVGEERLPAWPVEGTTGYDFLNAVSGVFVDPVRLSAIHGAYTRFNGSRGPFGDIVHACKKLVLEVSLSSELTVLARRLDRISEQHRYSRDFTLNSQQEALAEVIACFPVYRSYVRRTDASVGDDDRRHVLTALRLARRRNPAVSGSLFDFIGSVVLLEHVLGLDAGQLDERRDFVMRLQQLTGPVMAKGLEDTASYRYYPLASLNEVGGEPVLRPDPVGWFHADNERRLRDWPGSMTTTSTHDTKRDEDVRARIHVLSEVPERWEKALERWREMNRDLKSRVDDEEAPDPNTEYLFYQVLLGAWPIDAIAPGALPAEFTARMQAYMEKALREAKVHTSWVQPNEEYERAVRGFVAATLDPGHPFLESARAFVGDIHRPGLLGAVSQVLLKVAAPGVPDVYQGTELPGYRLVDPDNRGPVDYDLRSWLLGELEGQADADGVALADTLLRDLDGRLKLWVTARALNLRRRLPELFRQGEYVPLDPKGPRARHVVGFGRRLDTSAAIAVAGRFFTRLPRGAAGERTWAGTRVRWPGVGRGRWRCAITRRELQARTDSLDLGDVLRHLPVALLEKLP